MSDQPDQTAVSFTATELRLVESALRSFLSDFGHDESELVLQTRTLLDKVSSARSGSGPVADPGQVAQAAG